MVSSPDNPFSELNKYESQHLVSHLISARRVDGKDVHSLLAKETQQKSNAWYEAKEKIGDTAGFVADVSLAWKQAEEEFNQDLKGAIGRQCRYALITASINSLSANIPEELLITLLQKNALNPSQALAYILQSQDSRNQVTLLKAIIEYLPDCSLNQALQAAKDIESRDYRAEALQILVPYLKKLLPEALEEALRVALEAIRDTENEYRKAKVLQSLAPHLPNNLLSDALEVARKINCKYYKAMALQGFLVPYFKEDLLYEAKTVANAITCKYYRAEALQDLAPYLTVNELSEALTEVTSIQDEHFQALSLQRLAPYLTTQELINQALKAARNINSKYYQAMALQSLATHLTNEELFNEAREAAREIESEYYRVKALQDLAPYFPQEELLNEAKEAAKKINSEYYRAMALQSLAPHLTNEELSEALEVAREIESEYVQAEALRGLAPHLNNENLLRKALETAKAIKNKSIRTRALRGLAPHLSDENLLSETLKVIRVIGYGWHYDDALKALITNDILRLLSKPPLSQGFKLFVILFKKCLDFYYKKHRDVKKNSLNNIESELENAKNIMLTPTERAGILRDLAPHLTTQELLNQALKAASIIGSESSRSHALELLTLQLLTFSHPGFPLWQETLHILGTLNRRNCLINLCKLTPLILEFGDDEAIRETFKALKDVSRWWK